MSLRSDLIWTVLGFVGMVSAGAATAGYVAFGAIAVGVCLFLFWMHVTRLGSDLALRRELRGAGELAEGKR